MEALALLATACLFGGMTFFSFGFAPILFKQLPVAEVRPLLRGTFPYYYLAVIAVSGLAMLLCWFENRLSAILTGIIVVTTVFARQWLMPRINAATDADNQSQFKFLHGLSVVLQLVQIGLCGWALVIIN